LMIPASIRHEDTKPRREHEEKFLIDNCFFAPSGLRDLRGCSA
jgi:hypothetical protein